MDDEIHNRDLVLSFLKKCENSPGAETRYILNQIPPERILALENRLIAVLNELPEVKVRAFAAESELIYLPWVINKQGSHQVALSYDQYRSEVEALLIIALVHFSES